MCKTGATIYANSGATVLQLKKYGNWKSSSVAERYYTESLSNKRNTSDAITSGIHGYDSSSTSSSTSSSAVVAMNSNGNSNNHHHHEPLEDIMNNQLNNNHHHDKALSSAAREVGTVPSSVASQAQSKPARRKRGQPEADESDTEDMEPEYFCDVKRIKTGNVFNFGAGCVVNFGVRGNKK